MKKILFIGCFFFQAICYSQSQCYTLIEEDYKDLKRVNSIKKVEVKQTYPILSEDTTKHYWTNCYDCDHFFYELDSTKQISFVQSYDHNGLPSYQRINEFENENCIKSVEVFPDTNCNQTIIRKFDSDNQLIYFELRSKDNSIERAVKFEYRDSSFIKTTFLEPKSVSYPHPEFRNAWLSKKILVKKAMVRIYRKYKGDELFVRKIELGQTTLSSISKFKKTEDRWQCYSSKFILSHSKWAHKSSFSRNDSISRSSYRSKNSVSESIFRYDAMNNIVSRETTIMKGEKKGSKTTRTWAFFYDPKGNWIKKSEYENGELKTIVEREIIYYE